MAGKENIMDLKPDEPCLSSPTKVFLAGSLYDISFLVYDHGVNRFTFFEHFITHGLGEQAQVVYAYYSTNLVTPFKKEIQERKIILYELHNGVNGLAALINGLCHREGCSPGRVHMVVDFSRECDLHPVLDLLRTLKSLNGSQASVSGIVAFDLDILNDEYLREISAILPSIIFISDTTNIIAFPAVSRGPGIAGIVPQDIVDSVVRHSLEQLILMNLEQPVSGFDILKDISDRFHVEIPLARVYSYLYTLENKGLVTTQIRGRAKIYVPTGEGRVFIDRRLHDLRAAHEYILGYRH